MADSSGFRPACNGHCLAAQTLWRSLGATEQGWEPRVTAGQQGDSRFDSYNLPCQSAVGNPADCWRVGETWHRGSEVHSRQIPGAIEQRTVPDLEGVSKEPSQRSGID